VDQDKTNAAKLAVSSLSNFGLFQILPNLNQHAGPAAADQQNPALKYLLTQNPNDAKLILK
jgi:hypothetical protein